MHVAAVDAEFEIHGADCGVIQGGFGSSGSARHWLHEVAKCEERDVTWEPGFPARR